MEHEIRRLFPGLTLTFKPQAGLKIQDFKYLEASQLVALGSLVFPNSVALLAKEPTAITAQGLIYRAEVCMGSVREES